MSEDPGESSPESERSEAEAPTAERRPGSKPPGSDPRPRPQRPPQREPGSAPLSELRGRNASSLDASRLGRGKVPAYQVAGRMLLQGVFSGLAGGVPLVCFLFLAMALDGVSPPGLLTFVAGYLFFAAMISAWGAALTAVEEFARRADRSIARMVAASLGFPLFAVVAAGWIGGVVDGGPQGGARMVRMIVLDLFRGFLRQPGANLSITAAFLVPFLGLLLVRRREREQEGPLFVSRYYVGSAGLGLASATCVLFANLFWGSRLDGGPLMLGFTAMATMMLGASWGLARGRAVTDHYVRRYQRWAEAG